MRTDKNTPTKGQPEACPTVQIPKRELVFITEKILGATRLVLAMHRLEEAKNTGLSSPEMLILWQAFDHLTDVVEAMGPHTGLGLENWVIE